MRRKFITALSLVLVFSLLFGAQISSTVSADTKNGNPLTSPVTFFQFSGKLSYKFFKYFSGPTNTKPANVTVQAENIFTHDVYETKTDSNGNYTLSVEEKGVYLVKPIGGNTNVWNPPLRAVYAKKTGSANNINFQGLMLP